MKYLLRKKIQTKKIGICSDPEPDPDPHQNEADPKHCNKEWNETCNACRTSDAKGYFIGFLKKNLSYFVAPSISSRGQRHGTGNTVDRGFSYTGLIRKVIKKI